jgi:hypothetical protein
MRRIFGAAAAAALALSLLLSAFAAGVSTPVQAMEKSAAVVSASYSAWSAGKAAGGRPLTFMEKVSGNCPIGYFQRGRSCIPNGADLCDATSWCNPGSSCCGSGCCPQGTWCGGDNKCYRDSN